MKQMLPKGKYVVAVSGGVDSVVLLNMLTKQKDLLLVVAHFDHGIRPDSAEDRLFVQQLALQHGLPFEYSEGKLGASASEATAREGRYKFLHKVKEKYGAEAIITAHHQDDLVETAIINLLRGTGRKGLTALGSREDVVRPLLAFAKADIVEYAKTHKLTWREDSTNTDTKYLRNYIRHELIPKLADEPKQKLLKIIESQRGVNTELDSLLGEYLGTKGNVLDRRWFIGLPHGAAREVMAAWLRTNGLTEFDKDTIERAVIGAKTAKPGKKIEIKKGAKLEVSQNKLALIVRNDGRIPQNK